MRGYTLSPSSRACPGTLACPGTYSKRPSSKKTTFSALIYKIPDIAGAIPGRRMGKCCALSRMTDVGMKPQTLEKETSSQARLGLFGTTDAWIHPLPVIPGLFRDLIEKAVI